MIVRELRERGFRFVQLSELMASSRATPALVAPIPLAPLPPAAVDGSPAPPRDRAAPGGAPAATGSRPGAAMMQAEGRPRVRRPSRASRPHWIAGIEPWRGLGYRAARWAATSPGWRAPATSGSPGAAGASDRRGDRRRDGRFSAGRVHRPAGGPPGRERAGAGQRAGRARRGARVRPAALAVRLVRRRQPRRAAFLPPAGLRARRPASRSGQPRTGRAPAAQAARLRRNRPSNDASA